MSSVHVLRVCVCVFTSVRVLCPRVYVGVCLIMSVRTCVSYVGV